MKFQVKVRVNLSKMAEFGQELQKGTLDRSCIRGVTYCLKNDPAVGFSIWEAADKNEFEAKFSPWRNYYKTVEVNELITPQEAMGNLMARLKK
ncbi:MAG TPA: hypothetical protein PKI62_14130 [bacterium]|nr:hypothetical protein [bacterium]